MAHWVEIAVYAATAVFCGFVVVALGLRSRFLAADALVRHDGRLARIVTGGAYRSLVRYIGCDQTRTVLNRSLELVEPLCCEVELDGERIRLIGRPEPWHAPRAEVVRSVVGLEPYRVLYRVGSTYFVATQ